MSNLNEKGIGHTEFKDSELGKIPEGWSEYSLEQLGQVVGGGTPASETSEYWGGSIMWATPTEITNLKGRYIGKTIRTITDKGLQRSSTKLHPCGTILLTSRASIGYPAINIVPMATNQGFQSLRPNEKLDTEYGYQLLLQNRPSFERLSAGSTFLEISAKEINKFKLPIPPLPEQKKIASILTSVDEVIETTQKQIDKLQDLKKATMNELLTKGIGHTEFKDSELGWIPKSWEISSVGEVVQKIEGGGTPSRANPLFWGKEIPWATVKDLKAVRLTKTEESITTTGLSNSSSRMIPQGTVIIATRMAVGKTVIFDKEVSINQDLKALFPAEYLDSEYLLQWFLHNSEVVAALGTGSTVKGVRLEVLKGIHFLLPPLSEQKKIVSILSSMEQQVDVENQKLAQTQSLKKSLMQDLLTGKVRVQVN